MAGGSNIVIDKDKGYHRFWRRLHILGGYEALVGIPAKEGAEIHPEGKLTMAYLASIHEFGTPDGRIPERSFLRFTFDQQQKKYGRMIERGTANVLKKNYPPKMVLFEIAETCRGDVVLNIVRQRIKQDLKEATKKRKKSTKALIDKGHLVGSITAVVRKETRK